MSAPPELKKILCAQPVNMISWTRSLLKEATQCVVASAGALIRGSRYKRSHCGWSV